MLVVQEPPHRVMGNLDKIAWYGENSVCAAHLVGQKQANAWGLHDTLGNVWEWCYDWYGDYPAQAATDSVGANTGTHRVVRGGCWGNHADDVRAVSRLKNTAKSRHDGLGFRVVRSGL